jgi:BirA family biotin operon repressor/biotin-[acetyl-CoA-carboxylase] ligase
MSANGMELDPSAAGSGVGLVAYDSVGSTNAEALARARSGERGPLWITAGRQTAGRGRRGRGFVSEPGNLFASLLLTDPSPADRAAELSFVAALALHDAICHTAPVLAATLELKWPNDLLCDGGKLAGILVEGESGSGRPLAVVIGIGVNCAHHPDGLSYRATDLAACGATVTPQRLFAALSRSMVLRLAEWERGAGFEAVRRAWLALAAGVGERVLVRLPETELAGRFETLDAAGRLVLRRDDGRVELVTAGDMFPLSSTTGAAAEPLQAAGEPS